MENEIKRGDYVELTDSLREFHPIIISKLYDQHRGRIGLIRAVKYVPEHIGKIAEVIFSGVPYISEVPTKYLKRMGERLLYPGKNPKFPEPGMKVVSFSADMKSINAEFVHDVICPKIKPYYDCGYAPQHVYHDDITTNFKRGLADLIKCSENSLKGESNMKNTSNKPTPSNPIKQVIFNGPATIVYWKDGCKTIVKCQEGAVNDPEKGFAMAVARHYFCDILGMSRYDGIFKKYLPKETKEK